jgi:hypothetical protein
MLIQFVTINCTVWMFPVDTALHRSMIISLSLLQGVWVGGSYTWPGSNPPSIPAREEDKNYKVLYYTDCYYMYTDLLKCIFIFII